MNEILAAAADLIEQDGWCQGRLQNDRGERCIMGAISAAAIDHSFPELNMAADICANSLGVNIVDWNDKPERTQAEVVAALREAAER